MKRSSSPWAYRAIPYRLIIKEGSEMRCGFDFSSWRVLAYIAKLMFATLDLIEKYDLVIRLMDRRKLV